MKKNLIKLMSIAIVSVIVTLFAFPAFPTYAQTLRVQVDGEFIYIPEGDQPPILVGDNVLLPFRAVAEALGSEVEWESSPINRANATGRFAYFPVTIGSNVIPFGIHDYLMPIPAQLVNGRVMVSMEAFEIMPIWVTWDSANYIVSIRTGTVALPNPPPDTWPVTSVNWPEHLPSHIPGSINLLPDSYFSSLIDLSSPMQFRHAFYAIPGEFMSLVRDYDGSWFDNLPTGYHDMLLMLFVQYFNISREVFDDTVNGMREFRMTRGTDLYDERHELPNADIIFTFDTDIIRYFYRRE
ncbi:MAG: copper amine oxidase N-terminal domain-containing protein [Defluviitaleaceae bacterium]|nr:copper amine oxidase N-terminal domain-containing protein [Defluviitaleaceae bacterium]